MSDKIPLSEKGRSALQVGILAFILAALTRLPTLAQQSPWLDETTNWMLATEHGFHLRPGGGNPFTYVAQSLGLMISNSVFGLRLYSALFGIAAVVLPAAWATWRLGLLHGLLVTLTLAFNPFHIFYSQDANHYAPLLLESAIAVITVDLLLATQRPRLLWALASLIFCGILKGFHPAALFTAGGLAATIFLYCWIHADTAIPTSIHPRRKKLILALAVTLGLAAIAYPLFVKFGRITAGSGLEGRQFGLNTEFWQATLADFFGAMFRQRSIDTLLGITGLMLSMTGWICVAKRRPWAGLAALICTVAVLAPFSVADIRAYFAPRYLSGIQPILLMGAAFAIAEMIRSSRSRILAAAGLFWLGGYAATYVMWQANRLSGSLQPSYEVMRNLPWDAKILTRHVYSSANFDFLKKKLSSDFGKRRHVPLSYLHRLGAPSIQQAEEIAYTNPSGHTYFLSFIEAEDRKADDFSQWLDTRTEVIRRFSTNVNDAFVPIDWSINLRRVLTPERNPFALPRDGARTSSLYGESILQGVGRRDGGRLPLLRGTTAAWTIDIPTSASLALDFEWSGDAPEPQLALVSYGAPFEGSMNRDITNHDFYKQEELRLAQLPSKRMTGTLLLSNVPAGRRTLQLAMLRQNATLARERASLTIRTIRVATESDVPGDKVITGSRLTLVQPEKNPISRTDIHEPNTWVADAHGKPELILDSDTVDSSALGDGKHLLILTRTIGLNGLGDHWLYCPTTVDGKIIPVFAQTEDWTFDPMLTGTAVTAAPGTRIESRVIVGSGYGFRPRNYGVGFSDLSVWAEPE